MKTCWGVVLFIPKGGWLGGRSRCARLVLFSSWLRSKWLTSIRHLSSFQRSTMYSEAVDVRSLFLGISLNHRLLPHCLRSLVLKESDGID